ncbi:MAG TPA: hypothetical protein VJQ84_07910 [Solirubrobacterales bacterium]|nr:hypothetical protein [Solirubrobacterales bacterium]
MPTTIAVSGSIAQRPGRAGHAWVFLNYLLGLRDLGYEVLFLDRLEAAMLNGEGSGGDAGDSLGARWLVELMAGAGLDDSFALLLDDAETIGQSRRQALERIKSSSLLLDFNGFLDDEELLAAAPRRAYLDIDPGFAQMWSELGLADPFAGYDAFASVGLNLGSAECAVPDAGRDWVTTPQPVLLERWPVIEGGSAFTSVGSWRGPFGPVEYEGETYGLRAHEFRRFAELPQRIDAPCEIALDIDPADGADVERLEAGGWDLCDPATIAADLERYRAYLGSSRAEIGVAKGMYVRSRGGWFSDRSACYLASGKPVLAQDTGFGSALPVGEGLLSFDDVDSAAGAAEDVLADPRRHACAAREIAVEIFDSRKVLPALLERLGGV